MHLRTEKLAGASPEVIRFRATKGNPENNVNVCRMERIEVEYWPEVQSFTWDCYKIQLDGLGQCGIGLGRKQMGEEQHKTAEERKISNQYVMNHV